MDSDHSNDASGKSEPITVSPAQEYGLPDHQDGLKLESNVSNPEVAGRGPDSELPVQEHAPPKRGDGVESDSSDPNQEITGSESDPKPAAQEHLFLGSQEGQQSAVPTAVHPVIRNDNGQAGVWVPRIPVHRPMNTTTHGSIYSIRLEGFGKDPREYCAAAGLPDRQQAQLSESEYEYSSQYSWQGHQGGDIAQVSNSSVRDSSSVHNRTGAGAEPRYPRNQSGAAEPYSQHDSRGNATRINSNAASHGEIVFAPVRTNTPQLPGTSAPHRDQDSGLSPTNTSLLPTSDLIDSTQVDQWSIQPITSLLPSIYESRSVEPQTVGGQPAHFVQGPTRPPGPPLKPLDCVRSEAVAQEQWRRFMLETKRREAEGL